MKGPTLQQFIEEESTGDEVREMEIKIQVALIALHIKKGIVSTVDEWATKYAPVARMMLEGRLSVERDVDWDRLRLEVDGIRRDVGRETMESIEKLSQEAVEYKKQFNK